MATHELKTWPEPFLAVWEGRKTFEYRKDDREPRFRVGDLLHLSESVPPEGPGGREGGYTGRFIAARVTYIARNAFGIPQGYCVMGIRLIGRSNNRRRRRSQPRGSGDGALVSRGKAG